MHNGNNRRQGPPPGKGMNAGEKPKDFLCLLLLCFLHFSVIASLSFVLEQLRNSVVSYTGSPEATVKF